MKRFPATLLPLLIITLHSCGPGSHPHGEFRIVPSPRQFEISGSSQLEAEDLTRYSLMEGVELVMAGRALNGLQRAEGGSGAPITGRIDTTLELPSEGYILEISRRRVTIIGKDHAGLFYGFMTLGQLMEDAREQEVPLPACRIIDYPGLHYRAIHLDMKHHREKLEYYFDLVDWLASYKVNGIIAEMEDKLEYRRRPEVASADALSIETWKELSEYAAERNIEISPLIQGLGHASFVLKHEEFHDLRDDPGSDWAFNPLDPGTYRVQFDLYRDALEATPNGRFLHVGGDEVHTTGRGSGKSPLELQLIWLDSVCRFAEEHGRVPIFWDDMPLKHAGVYRAMFDPGMDREAVHRLWEENEASLLQFLDRFPKNCIYMRWNYSHPGTEGNLKAMEWFRDHGLQVMGATAGQTRWVLMPQNESNMENIRSFALSSMESGLQGLLLTLWDDDSPHFELYKRGILAFAEYAWAGDRRSREEVKAVYQHREFSHRVAEPAYAFIDMLEEPVAFWNNALLKEGDRRALSKMERPLEEAVIDLPDPDRKGEWSERYEGRLAEAEQMAAICDTVAERIDALVQKAERNHHRLEIYRQVNRMARFAPEALLALAAFDRSSTPAEEREALEEIHQLPITFQNRRERLEEVFGETRILEKPAGYILDQDHHNHLANQSITFDWQFIAEMLFLEKMKLNVIQ